MEAASSEFMEAVWENPAVDVYVDLKPWVSGELLSLWGDTHVEDNSLVKEEAICASGSFDPFCATVGSCTLTLIDLDGVLRGYDLREAEMDVYVRPKRWNGPSRKIGTYIVDDFQCKGHKVSVTALDKLSLLRAPVGKTGIDYSNVTHLGFVEAVCAWAGIEVVSRTNFASVADGVKLRAGAVDEDKDCFDLLVECLEVLGVFGRMNEDGKFEMGDLTGHLPATASGITYPTYYHLDGGYFDNPGTNAAYASGVEWFGGNLPNINDGQNPSMVATQRASMTKVNYTPGNDPVLLQRPLSLEMGFEDRKVTGIYTQPFTGNELVLRGNDSDLTLDYSNNPLLNNFSLQYLPYGSGLADVTYINRKLLLDDVTFRPFKATVPADPTLRVGLPCLFYDVDGCTQHVSYITRLAYSSSGSMTLSCECETYGYNRAKRKMATQGM